MPRAPLLVALVTLLCGGVATLAAAAEDDLSVAWIARLPRIDYVWDSNDPTVEGWPEPGRRVTWVAHVRNLTGDRIPSVGYRWLLDGDVVESGRRSLASGGTTEFRLDCDWERERHELVFEIDPEDAVGEIEERNNRLLVHTDALAVGIWVEEAFRSGIRDTLTRSDTGTVTFDDYMQRRIRQYNEMAALARYPETPDGVIDRWRIDAIHTVPDGALPLSPVPVALERWPDLVESADVRYPDVSDRSVDIQWGFPTRALAWFEGNQAWNLMYDSFVHELGHARTLVDVYGWNVDEERDLVERDGPAIVGGTYHETHELGLMNTNWGRIDRYSAVVLNRMAGQRATHGNYNPPENYGHFLNDLPEENRIRLVTPEGEVFPRRRVRIYRASSERQTDPEAPIYRLHFDRRADLRRRTDADGVLTLGPNPFSDADVVMNIDQINSMVLVEVIDEDRDSHWGFLESRVFNLAFWRGDTEVAEYDLLVDAPPCDFPSVGPMNTWPRPWALEEPGEVFFSWPAQGADSYTLSYSVDGTEPERVEVDAAGAQFGTISTEIPLDPGVHVAWWVGWEYTEDARGIGGEPEPKPHCPDQRSALYFFDVAGSR